MPIAHVRALGAAAAEQDGEQRRHQRRRARRHREPTHRALHDRVRLCEPLGHGSPDPTRARIPKSVPFRGGTPMITIMMLLSRRHAHGQLRDEGEAAHRNVTHSELDRSSTTRQHCQQVRVRARAAAAGAADEFWNSRFRNSSSPSGTLTSGRRDGTRSSSRSVGRGSLPCDTFDRLAV